MYCTTYTHVHLHVLVSLKGVYNKKYMYMYKQIHTVHCSTNITDVSKTEELNPPSADTPSISLTCNNRESLCSPTLLARPSTFCTTPASLIPNPSRPLVPRGNSIRVAYGEGEERMNDTLYYTLKCKINNLRRAVDIATATVYTAFIIHQYEKDLD